MSLADLFAAHGTTAGRVALALTTFSPSVDPLLFDRVSSLRQPLPTDVAAAIARLLGVDVGTVLSAARLVTDQSGAPSRVPLPPDPLLGDLIYPADIHPLQNPVPAPMPLIPQVWVAGAGVAPGPNPGAAQLVYAGPTLTTSGVLQTAYSTSLQLASLAFDGTNVWTFGSAAGGGGNTWTSLLSTVPGTGVTAQGHDPALTRVSDATYEPVSKTMWACDNGGTTVCQVSPTTQAVVASVTLTSGGHSYAPAGVVAVGGKLYVTAQYAPGGGVEPDGRLFVVDPLDLAVVGVSAGANMVAPWGVCFDPAGQTFYVFSDSATGSWGSSNSTLWALDRATLTAAAVPVTGLGGRTGWPGFSGGRWVTLAYGTLWVSGQFAFLHAVPLGSFVVTAWRQFKTSPGPIYGGRATGDGAGFLWVADPANGKLHLLNPTDLSDAAVFDVSNGAGGGSGGAEPIACLALVPGVAPTLVP